jgi:hypothetical protein
MKVKNYVDRFGLLVGGNALPNPHHGKMFKEDGFRPHFKVWKILRSHTWYASNSTNLI